ncbi:MAG: hypothetical protein HC919_10985 [Oscillatoriales cyanobacterium SM2_2_1]|nr:hypothetical protein [Oscillatoriales cyanobacterium SM2_2_1]
MASTNRANDLPVTVDVLQRVKLGKEERFELLLEQIIGVASNFDGYLGASIFCPGNDGSEYRIIFKFDRLKHLKLWEHSAIRQKLLVQAKELTTDLGSFSIITGLETWFTLPSRSGLLPPSRCKMVVISTIAILGLSQLIAWLPLDFMPSLIRPLTITFGMTLLMTYVVMPRPTKLLARWLYPSG